MIRLLGPVTVAIAGIGLLTVMDGLVKLVSTQHDTLQVVLMRYLFGGVAAFILFVLSRTPWPGRAALRAHGLRAVTIVVTASAFFYALSVLPLAVALALSFTSPFFIAIAAQLILGERPHPTVWFAVAIGFAGVLVVLSGEIGRSGQATLGGIAAAMLAAVSYALVMVLLKSRTSHDPLPTIVLLQNVIPAGLMVPFGALAWTPPAGTILLWFALIGVLGTAGHLALAWAYGRADASRLGVLEYTAFVWGVLIGFVWFGEVPSPATLAGTALIIAGAVLVARPQRDPAQKAAVVDQG
jgi:drug/metabolite transporter (DMT)-like permease